MLKRLFKFLRRLILTLGAMGLVGLILPRILTTTYAVDRIFQKESAPAEGIAIVFGAGLRRDGTPAPTLRVRDRLKPQPASILAARSRDS